jgi:hypothetical protein
MDESNGPRRGVSGKAKEVDSVSGCGVSGIDDWWALHPVDLDKKKLDMCVEERVQSPRPRLAGLYAHGRGHSTFARLEDAVVVGVHEPWPTDDPGS